MGKCTQCRKNDALDTWWEKKRWWLFHRLFPKDIIDLSQDKFTQGFGDGYKTGYQHGYEAKTVQYKGKLFPQVDNLEELKKDLGL